MKNLSQIIKNSNGSTPNNADYFMAVQILKGNREYVNYGGSRYAASKDRNPQRYLSAYGIDFQCGNDAPRGGKIGNYIELSKKGMLQTKVYRAEVALELAKLKAERLEQKEVQEQKLKVSENEIIENIKKKLQFFANKKSKLSQLKLDGNKAEWQILANSLIQKSCNNDFSIGWSNIYKLIQNNA